jgi:hypothetical protein
MHVCNQMWIQHICVEKLCHIFLIIVRHHQTIQIIIAIPILEFVAFHGVNQLTFVVVTVLLFTATCYETARVVSVKLNVTNLKFREEFVS